MRRKYLVYFTGIILIVTISFSITACENHQVQSFRIQKPSESQDSTAHRYQYVLENRNQTKMTVRDQKFNLDNRSTLRLLMEPMEDSGSSKWIKMTYQRIAVHLEDKDGQQMDYASDIPDTTEPINQVLKAVAGSSLLLLIDSSGNITSTRGSDEIIQHVLAKLSFLETTELKTVRQQLSQLVGTAFLKDNFSNGFKWFPDSVGKVGQTWKRKEVTSQLMPVDLLTTFTITDADDSICVLKSVSELTNNNQSISYMGYDVASDLEGSQVGHFKINWKTGVLQEGSTDAKIGGNLIVQGTPIPIVVHFTKSITVNRL